MRFDLLASVQRRLLRIRREFSRLWKNYLYQSFLATVVVLIVFLLLSAEHAVVIASIGATAFIVFTMPRNITAKPRRVIGGHLVGLFSGSLCSLIPHSSICRSYRILGCGRYLHPANGSPGRGAPTRQRDGSGNRHHRFFSQRNACRPDQQHNTLAGTSFFKEISERPDLDRSI